jgi:hypothetical protein
MAPPRVLVGPLPRLLCDLVRGLVGDPCVATADDRTSLVEEAARLSADVVVAAIVPDAEAARTSSALSARRPGAALVNLDRRGRFAIRYVAGDVVARAEDLSPTELRVLLGT